MGCPERPLLQDIINSRSRAKVIAPTPADPVTPQPCSKVLMSRVEKAAFFREWSQVPQAGENVSGLLPPTPTRTG